MTSAHAVIAIVGIKPAEMAKTAAAPASTITGIFCCCLFSLGFELLCFFFIGFNLFAESGTNPAFLTIVTNPRNGTHIWDYPIQCNK